MDRDELLNHQHRDRGSISFSSQVSYLLPRILQIIIIVWVPLRPTHQQMGQSIWMLPSKIENGAQENSPRNFSRHVISPCDIEPSKIIRSIVHAGQALAKSIIYCDGRDGMQKSLSFLPSIFQP